MARAIDTCAGCKTKLTDSNQPWRVPTVALRTRTNKYVQKYPLTGSVMCNDCLGKFPLDWWAFPHEPGTNIQESFKRFITDVKAQFPDWDLKL